MARDFVDLLVKLRYCMVVANEPELNYNIQSNKCLPPLVWGRIPLSTVSIYSSIST